MKPRREAPDAERLRRIRSIQATRRQLELEDNEYRDLVARVSKEHGPEQRSAGDCNLAQLRAVANELQKRAGKPAGNAANARQWRGRPKGDLTPQLGKVEALLADAGREWAYAHAVAKRLCRVERVDWCNPAQLSKVIAALQLDADRRARGQVAR